MTGILNVFTGTNFTSGVTPLGQLGSLQSKATTPLANVITATSFIPSGTLLVLGICHDNATATTPTLTINNTTGTGWSFRASVGANATATAGAGIFLRVYTLITSSDIAANATITTVTFSTLPAGGPSRAISVWGFTKMTNTLRNTISGVPYTFSTTTTNADPGNGVIRYNNATIGSVTNIYIDNLNSLGTTQTAWYATWDDTTSSPRGQITITHSGGTNVFNVSGAVTANTGYYTIPVTFVSGTLPTNASSLTLSFTHSAAVGTSTGGTPTATTIGTTQPAAGNLVIGLLGSETDANATRDSDTTNGSWSTLSFTRTTGGNAATNVTVGMQYKIVTATGNQTYNPTSANDSAVAVFTMIPS